MIADNMDDEAIYWRNRRRKEVPVPGNIKKCNLYKISFFY
jgi:hypothetical protein